MIFHDCSILQLEHALEKCYASQITGRWLPANIYYGIHVECFHGHVSKQAEQCEEGEPGVLALLDAKERE